MHGQRSTEVEASENTGLTLINSKLVMREKSLDSKACVVRDLAKICETGDFDHIVQLEIGFWYVRALWHED